METRYCPNCGKPLAFLPSRNRYFCNYCRLPFDADSPSQAPSGPLSDASEQDIPTELAGLLPAEPSREVTLYAPTSDLKPMVRRSSLLKGTVEAMTDDEARRAMQTGDYIILSKVGRCAIVAARKAFGEAQIVPRALDMPGFPWRVQISSDAASVELGLFKGQPAPPMTRMPQPRAYAPEEFYVASLTLKGQPPALSRFVTALVEMLEEPPWASRYWALLSQSLGLPASKLLLDWKQYLDYAGARVAVGEVAAARREAERARQAGFREADARAFLDGARAELSRGDWDAARAKAREVRGLLEEFQRQRQRVRELQACVQEAVSEIRRLQPDSEQASLLDNEMNGIVSDTSLSPDDAVRKAGAVMGKAAFQLFSVHVEKANSYLSDLQSDAPDLSRQLRVEMQGELERGRRLLESGNIQGGMDVLGRALASMKESASGHFSDLAPQVLEQARQAFSSLPSVPARTDDSLAGLGQGLDDAQKLLDEGRSAEAGRAALKLKAAIEEKLEASAPEIRVGITGPALTAGGWNRVTMKVANTGTAEARSLKVTIDGPVELMAMDDIKVLKAGSVYNDDIGVRCASPGTVPVKLMVDCDRAPDDKSYHFEAELWLEFRQPLDLSGAKSITIDRSVHIVDSVLNRSAVGAEDEMDGLPQASPDEDGNVTDRRVIQDSVMNRSGRRDRQPPAQVETTCPKCGRTISTEWKRCPYCS